MSRDITVDSLFFGVEQVPVEAVANLNGKERRIVVPGKKALLNAANGTVLGIVSRDYRVVTNKEAVEIAREVCAKAFPGIAPLEWEASRASAPRTLSYAFIDLMHRTHVLTFGGPEMARTKKPRSSKPKRGSKTKKPHATSNSGMSKVRKNHWAAPSICGFSTSWPLLYGPVGGGSSCVFSGGAFEMNRRRH